MQYEIDYKEADEFIVTTDMRERKAKMEEKADGFIAMPGGFGTLEELMEILTSKQLQLHSKAVVLLNTRNFYGLLLELFEKMFEEKFAKPMHRDSYFIAETAAQVVDYIKHYSPKQMEKKWF